MRQTVLALGFFDGVHLGHAALLGKTADIARRYNACPLALSFDRHPRAMAAGHPIPLLCCTEERRALIRAQGIEEIVLLPFTEDLRRVSWRGFADSFLAGAYDLHTVVVGYDCRFGYQGEGTPELLGAYGGEKGFVCEIMPPLRLDGIRVSSTYIRGLVAEGDMKEAARFLGRPYSLSGEVRHGDGLGRQFGFPTVNLLLPEDRQWPLWGVYATVVRVRGRSYGAVTNVGMRPTVSGGGRPTVESTLFDFDEDVYGEEAVVDFHHFLRPERRFPDIEALQAQVREDIETAKRYQACSKEGNKEA